MKAYALTAAAALMLAPSFAAAQQPNVAGRRLSPEDVRRVAPALEKYTQQRLYGEVWNRPGLSRRDRSLVTVAALIARELTGPMPYYFGQALDAGLKPGELSEIITHLAFYSGWANAFAAVGPARDLFDQRGIGPERMPSASPALLPLNEAAEADREKRVGDQFAAMFPGMTHYTTDVLFRDLWLRPDLAPRDRSLATISALVANGQFAQLGGHITIGLNNGLTQPEIAEAITHLAFYAGWPNAFSAMTVAKEVLQRRPR